MKKKNVLAFIFNGYADWELSYVSAGINKSDTHRIRTIALEKTPVVSMGGITALPDFDYRPQTDLTDIDIDTTSMLILPGGQAWEQNENDEIASLVRHCIENGIPVAAICGATILLANLGLLDHRFHTSNGPLYLSEFSNGYKGVDCFVDEPVLDDAGIVTAAGNQALMFADAIFNKLEIMDDENVRLWFRHFQNKMVLC